jgi:hypothetical protein
LAVDGADIGTVVAEEIWQLAPLAWYEIDDLFVSFVVFVVYCTCFNVFALGKAQSAA